MSAAAGRVRSYDEFRALRRFPALDGLRAISITIVVFEHSHNLTIRRMSGGFNGVLLFFVISGFLITSLLLREESASGKVKLGAFAVRRFFRILPLYYAVVILYLILDSWLRVESKGATFVHVLPYYVFFFQEHVQLAPHPASVPFYPFQVSWSLGFEEKFYLVWPLIAFGVLVRCRRLRVPIAAVAALACATAPLLYGHGGYYVFYYAAILCGCIAAMAAHARRSYEYVSRLGSSWGLGVAIGLAAVAFGATYFQPGRSDAFAAVTYAVTFPAYAVMVVALVIAQPRAPHRVLDSKPLVTVGTISYAMYLLHLFFVNGAERFMPDTSSFAGELVAIVVAFALTVLAALPVQRYFESPLTRVGHRLSDRMTAGRAGLKI